VGKQTGKDLRDGKENALFKKTKKGFFSGKGVSSRPVNGRSKRIGGMRTTCRIMKKTKANLRNCWEKKVPRSETKKNEKKKLDVERVTILRKGTLGNPGR